MHDRILIQELGQGQPALRLLREHVSEHLCDIAISGPRDDFGVRSRIIPVDQTPLIDTRIGAVQYDRTPRHIARGGIDHYQIALCVDGEMTYTAGRRSVTLREGDLCLVDLALPSRTVLTAGSDTRRSRNVVLSLPRSSLSPLLAAPDGASASYISGGSRQGRLLAGHLLAIRRARTKAATSIPAAGCSSSPEACKCPGRPCWQAWGRCGPARAFFRSRPASRMRRTSGSRCRKRWS
jgi:AraC-binding-like domain